MMLINRDMSPWRALYVEFRLRPLSVTVPVIMIPTGIMALILGEGASRAFTIIGGEGGSTGALIAHMMGLFLALGGALAILGTVRFGTLIELIGLMLVAAGAFIYAAGVVIGLGFNGVIAGGGFLSISLGCAGRVVLLADTAKRLFERE